MRWRGTQLQKRRLQYRLFKAKVWLSRPWRLFTWPLGLASEKLYLCMRNREAARTEDGILIYDWPIESAPGFEPAVREALDLIKSWNERRYLLVRARLQAIVNTYLVSRASYREKRRECCINFRRYPQDWNSLSCDERRWYATAIASSIIHEMTHARLGDLGFPYVAQTRTRHEYICCEEQRRFLQRIPYKNGTMADVMWEPIDPVSLENWWDKGRRENKHQLRKQAWQEFKATIGRIFSEDTGDPRAN